MLQPKDASCRVSVEINDRGAVSETIDWLVYSLTRRPFADRVLLSTCASAPIDSAVFLLLAEPFTWQPFAIGVASTCSEVRHA